MSAQPVESSQNYDFDSLEPYSLDNQPSHNDQVAFFHNALLESAGAVDPTKYMRGPWANDFTDILQDVAQRLRALGPNVTPEYIMPLSYQSHAVREAIKDMNDEPLKRIVHLRDMRTERVERLGVETIGPHIMQQILEPGVLNTPPYAYQGEHWDGDSPRACANACFRMVFEGITGWKPYEDVIAQQMIDHHGSHIVDDSEYHKIFATDIFSEITSRRVRTVEIIGADLRTIGNIALRLKQKGPDTQVYSIVSLGSQSAARDVWHTCVLTGADETEVICHDPGSTKGCADKAIRKTDFARRWAITYNRAQIIVAA